MDTYDEFVESGYISIMEYFDDSDELLLFDLKEELFSEHEVSSRKGSQPGRKNVNRDFNMGYDRLVADYFAESPVYDEIKFCRRFRMPRTMFLRILKDVENKNDYFKLRSNAAGTPGLTGLQKCVAAVRMLAYGIAADAVDEYVRIGASTAMESLRNFCTTVVEVYGDIYLRVPNNEDIRKIVIENESRGFPGMLGSIDCMHWEWGNCPVAFKGQYVGKDAKPTVVLEAIASYDTHIWHCFFGMPGSCNDINVVDRSPILNNIVNGKILKVEYILNGTKRDRGYFLADGIYPDWPVFMKTVSHPSNNKEKLFAKKQEAARKDVERAFGILKKCWHILTHPCRLWDVPTMTNVMQACIILHNMRIEYHCNMDNILQDDSETIPHTHRSMENCPKSIITSVPPGTFAQFCAERMDMKNTAECASLRKDLIDHVWSHQGSV
ncbi:uncharacterized protein LOC134203287 [Armigeres subalbatus]|uniref:uncharacterized protein LOC134203287 n=1 Tax=Armigeres subalbatus TaxID=124917 RepID=UPI002ED340D6